MARLKRKPVSSPNRIEVGLNKEWPLVLVIALILFVVYAITSPRTATLEDDGLFIIAGLHAGVAHPPGYPLFTVVGYLFSFLPIDPPALRIHLLSGVFGALAGGVFYLAVRLAGLSPWFAVTAALAYGLSEHFWSQAIIAEVYTLNAFLCFSVLMFCLRASQRRGAAAQREMGWAAICFSLGLANHWPLMVAAFPGFAILLLPQTMLVFKRFPVLLLMALAPAGLLYFWMAMRSLQEGVISFYGPLATFEDFWYYLTRKGYGGVDSSPSSDFGDKALFVWHFLKEVFFLYTPVGLLLAFLGIYRLHQRQETLLLAATGWIFFAHSLLLILMLGFDYEYLNLAVFRPYPLVAYGILAFWMGQGLTQAWTYITPYLQKAAPVQNSPSQEPEAGSRFPTKSLIKSLPAIALLIPALVLYKNFPINDRRDDTTALRYAKSLLENLEPNAVLFVTGDLPTAPVGYLHFGEGYRPDVEVRNTQGLVYPARLFYPPTTKKNETNLTREFVINEKRPLYYTTNIVDFPNPWGSIHFGLYRKVEKEGPELQLRFDQQMEDYFYWLIDNLDTTDRWNRHLHDRLMQQFGEFIGYMVLSSSSDPAWISKRDKMMEAMQKQYFGLIGMSEMLIKYGTVEHLRTVQRWLATADTLIGDTLSKEMVGRHHYRRGYLAYRLGQRQDARDLFNRSLEVHNHPENPSIEALKLVRRPNERGRRQR